MTFEEAFDKAVRAFYEGKSMTEFEKATGTPLKYNKKFFDDFEEEVRPKSKSKSKNKNSKVEVEDEELDVDELELEEDDDDAY